MKKKLNYDYCQAAPVLEWMSQKWALVVMLRIEEYEKESIRFSELSLRFLKKYLRQRLIIYCKKDLLQERDLKKFLQGGEEYSLTPIAKDFLREISYVIEWGQLHFEQIVKGRK